MVQKLGGDGTQDPLRESPPAGGGPEVNHAVPTQFAISRGGGDVAPVMQM